MRLRYSMDPASMLKILILLLTLAVSAAAQQTEASAKKGFCITEFGAIGDGNTLNTTAIQSAMNAAHAAGGGTVVVPKGTFVTGTIEIKSRVTLHLNKGAVLLGSSDTTHYPNISPDYESFLTRPDLYPQKVLIYAKHAHQVGITGAGTIDGNGHHPNLFLGGKQKNRRQAINLIRFIQCQQVTMQGESSEHMLRITNSGHWGVQPMKCDGVHLQYVRIQEYGGITPDALPISDCRNVLVEDCYISSDDDALGLKNGSPHIVVENIVVRRCILESANTGFKGGSPQSFGAFKQIKFIGCTFRKLSDALNERPSGNHHGFFVGILNGGGSFEDVLIEDCIVEESKMPFAMYIGNKRNGYWAQWWKGKDAVNRYGTIKNVTTRNLSYRKPHDFGVLIEGREGYEIENLLLENVYLPFAGGLEQIPAIPKEKKGSYPNMSSAYNQLPAYGFFLRHVKGVTMKNVWVWPLKSDARPPIRHVHATELDLAGLNAGKAPDNYLPALSFDLDQKPLVAGSTPQTIRVHARDHDGTIQEITLLNNGTNIERLKEHAPSQWATTVKNLEAGILTVQAKDNHGDISKITMPIGD